MRWQRLASQLGLEWVEMLFGDKFMRHRWHRVGKNRSLAFREKLTPRPHIHLYPRKLSCLLDAIMVDIVLQHGIVLTTPLGWSQIVFFGRCGGQFGPSWSKLGIRARWC